MSFIAVAYYTEHTLYELEVALLEETCAKFGIKIHIEAYRDQGSWVKNCALKPLFIYDMLCKHPFTDILYIDADARVRKYPGLFDDFKGDIGVHYRKRHKWHRELLSGTIYLKNNERVRKLIKHWAEVQQKNKKRWDQKVFQDILAQDKTIKVVELPPTYTQIFDSMKGAGEPVIEHFQASRRIKRNPWIPEIYPSSIVPESIGGIRIRRDINGSYYITRKNRPVEKYMDKECIRFPNELRWRPKFDQNESLETLRREFEGKICYIIGKGPSLDHLDSRHFKHTDSPIVCLNESIFKVESLNLPNFTICLQQDSKLRDTCYPKSSPIIVSTKAVNFYAEKTNVFVFDNTRLGLSRNALSVSAAITITKKLGCTAYIMCCFDACVTKATKYAKCVGYDATWGGNPKRFLDHIYKIRRRAGVTPLTWMVPNVEEIKDDFRSDAELGRKVRKVQVSTSRQSKMGKEEK